ncbi:MAG: PAS domain S-box protein [Sulfuricella sp.]|nr:PAS domain S-box protein [Sulfuricella sp.]
MVGPITKQSASPPLTVTSKPFISRLIGGVLLINLLVLTLIWLSMQQSYRHYQEQAELNTQNLTRVLENEIAGYIRAVDVALVDVIDEYQEQRNTSRGVDKNAFNTHIKRMRLRLPEIDALRIADAQGMLVYGSDVVSNSRVNIADRPHFIRLRENPKLGLLLSKPQISRINQKWVILLVRRIEQPDGSFGGIAFAAITLERLSQTFSAIDVGPHGSIVLRDGELGTVARYPEPRGVGNLIGSPGAPLPLREMIQAGRKAITYQNYSGVDGFERTVSYRQIDDLPLFVAVGLATADYFAEWRRQAIKIAALAVLFFLVTLCSAWLIYRGWQRQTVVSSRLEAELREREQVEAMLRNERDFAESLIDTAQTIVLVLDVEGRIIRINAYLETLSGYSQEEVRGKDWFGTFLPPQIQAQTKVLFLEAINDFHANGNVNAIVARDGREKLIEWYDKTLKDADGRVVGLLAIGLDVTARKRAEQEVLQYRDHLEEMVAARTREVVAAMEKLQEAERRERTMLESLPVGVRLSSNDGKNTLYLNPYFTEMFGYSIEDIPNLARWWILAYPDPEYRAWVSNEYKRLINIAKEGKGEFEPMEVQITSKDGAVKYIRVHITFMDDHHFATFIDLSDRKWVENALVALNDSLAQRVAQRTQALTQKAEILEEEIKNRRKLEIHLLLVSEEERLHLGSELHDNVGQTLTAIGFFASALFNELSKSGSQSSQKAKHIAELVGEATRTVRYLSNGLIQFDISRQGLKPSLAHLASDVSGVSGIPCEFRSSGCDEIGDFAIVTHLFRIAQEALNNALKHSAASKLTIDLESDEKEVRLIVRDDGVGYPACVGEEGKSRGLMTMDYRAKLIGATLTISAAQPQGTAVVVVLSKIS